MLKIASKVEEKKASKSKHDVFVNPSKEFVTYLEMAKKIAELNTEIKAYEAEVAPLYNDLKSEALKDMEQRKDFHNFKWKAESTDGEVTVILADKYSSMDESILDKISSIGYTADDFVEASYSIDNSVMENPEILADIQELADKWAKKNFFILKRKITPRAKVMDKIRELKDSRLISILRPLLSFRLGGV